jgi:transposase-like protein
VEEALIEMYLAGVSVRRVEDITEVLWGAKVSPGTISELNKKVYVRVEEWRNRPLKCEYPYVHLDGIYLKRNWGGSIENVAVLVALGVNEEGNREIIGACEGGKEDTESWLNFLRHLKQRGLRGTRLFIGDKCLGLRLLMKYFRLPSINGASCIFTGTCLPLFLKEKFRMLPQC